MLTLRRALGKAAVRVASPAVATTAAAVTVTRRVMFSSSSRNVAEPVPVAVNAKAASIETGIRNAASTAAAENKSADAASSQQQVKLFDKILVANRGEIACRIFRTCKKLGIKTVAVFSEADANSQHVKLADEAICIGPAAALQSYLLPERILAACKATGAQAVHPGYGFLSENSEFCRLLETNGITFIGPKADTIKEMGDKIRSKMIAEKAGVLHIPGFVGAIRDEAHLLEVANKIGYPVMVKAAHGGGGKGMRRANNDQECKDGYRLSLNEARTSFNSSVMLVEKFIEDPRHIEFQVMADAHGNAVYVFERECSVQRRNQKLVEEAPSTFLSEEERKRIGEQAVRLAKVSNYQNAGTVEFLMGRDGQHYYLEMNTRLQVEHPISEMISGLDLVEQQIRVAAGLPLTITQEDLKINGWAVEARVCAEDPLNSFLPSVGTLTKFRPPEGVRVDLGFIEGDNISIHYDSLLAKVITHAPTRNEALALQKKALDSMVIRGLQHNICFLREVMEHPKFVAGKLTTNFIQENFPQGFLGHVLKSEEKRALLAAAASVFIKNAFAETTVVEEGNDALYNKIVDSKVREFVLTAHLGGEKPEVFTVRQAANSEDSDNYFVDTYNFAPYGETAESKNAYNIGFSSTFMRSNPVFEVDIEDKNHVFQTVNVSGGAHKIGLSFMGTNFDFEVHSPEEYKLVGFMPEPDVIDLTKSIVSPMPGSVFSVAVKPGDKVAAGQELIILEAMKMQNSLKAAKPGVVKAVNVKKGDTVAADQLLLELE